MPIRFVDRSATIVGRVAAALGNATAAVTGTFVAPAGRTGSVHAQLQDSACAMQGIFQSNSNRTGTIVASLGDMSGFFNASLASASSNTFTFTVEGSGTEWATFGHEFARGEIPAAAVIQTSGGGQVTHQA